MDIFKFLRARYADYVSAVISLKFNGMHLRGNDSVITNSKSWMTKVWKIYVIASY